MGVATRLVIFSLAGILTACAGFQVAGQFQSGRQALLINQPETALAYFLAAADRDPDYVYQSVYFHEGIWTYVGRTQYATGKFNEARQSLERALAKDQDDNMARLYLGLTLARSGDATRGVKEIESGMKGLHDWLEYIERTRPFEAYWDPTREIRGAIEKDLEKISAKDFDLQQLIADAEWLGQRMESEIDRARRDERRRYENDFDRRRGPSVGVGIGF
jgi:tetratricopeptide (TPR) repeat protein